MATQVNKISASFAALSFTPQTQGHFPAKYAEVAPTQVPSARQMGLLLEFAIFLSLFWTLIEQMVLKL